MSAEVFSQSVTKLNTAIKDFENGEYEKCQSSIDELVKISSIEKFPPLLCKAYSLLSNCIRILSEGKNTEWIVYAFKCLSPRLNKFLPQQVYNDILGLLFDAESMDVDIESDDENCFSFLGGFSQKQKVVDKNVDFYLNVTSMLPYPIKFNSIHCNFEIIKATNKEEKIFKKIQISEEDELIPCRHISFNKILDVEEHDFKITVTKCIIRINNLNVAFKFNKSKYYQEITFMAPTEGCSTEIDCPPFAVVGVKCPIEFTMKAGPQDTVFKLSTEKEELEYELKANETKNCSINIENDTPTKYTLNANWRISINLLEAQLPPSTAVISFTEPFMSNSVVYDQNNKVKVKGEYWHVGDEFTVMTVLKSVLDTDVVVNSIELIEGNVTIIPLKKEITLKRFEAFTFACFGKVTKYDEVLSLGKMEIKYTPKNYYTEPANYLIELPNLFICTDVIKVHIDSNKSICPYVQSKVVLTVSSEEDVEIIVEVDTKNKDFYFGGISPYNIHLEANDEKRIVYTFIPMVLDNTRYPEIKATIKGANTPFWSAAPPVFVNFVGNY